MTLHSSHITVRFKINIWGCYKITMASYMKYERFEAQLKQLTLASDIFDASNDDSEM